MPPGPRDGQELPLASAETRHSGSGEVLRETTTVGAARPPEASLSESPPRSGSDPALPSPAPGQKASHLAVSFQ